jgi:CRP/FNR family transcriptional regulator, cyclic AMP receptor protein
MACYIAGSDLFAALEQRCERVRKPRSSVLFRRGEKAFGMFLVLRGTVSLDFGVDAPTALASTCGPGALVGLPTTLTRTNYRMTATVTDDAELGFLTPQALVSLLRKQPELRLQLLTILSAKVAHSEQVTKALLRNEKLPRLEWGPA